MIDLGLQRVSRLLARIPLPWRAVHVAGTNGKGSVCAGVSSMLDAYNDSTYARSLQQPRLKHARFTSPHLIDRWDCIAINQETVPFSLFHEVEKAVLLRNEQEGIGATEFELLTATAFEIFTREEVDVGVVEVGMGGRLDATNVLGQIDGVDVPSSIEPQTFRAPPLVTAITHIGLDHQGFLGNTLRDIAEQKAGIMKPGIPVVTEPANLHGEVRDVLCTTAARCGVDIVAPTRDLSIVRLLDERLLERQHPLAVALRKNIWVAACSTIMALQELQRIPRSSNLLQFVDDDGNPDQETLVSLLEHLFRAARNSHVPGRTHHLSIEALTARPQSIVLDGAHNPQSAEVLAAHVKSLLGETAEGESRPPVNWVLAASDSKDVAGILEPLLGPTDRIHAVEFGAVDGMPWVHALPAAKLAEVARKLRPQSLAIQDHGKDVLGALKAASEEAEGGVMVVAGSLYLVGHVLRLLREHEVKM